MPFKPFTPQQEQAYKTTATPGFKPINQTPQPPEKSFGERFLENLNPVKFAQEAMIPAAQGTWGVTGAPMVEAAGRGVAQGAQSAKASLAAASSLNPFDFKPQEFGDRMKQAYAEPMEIGPFKAFTQTDAQGNVDAGKTFREGSGEYIKGLAGAANTATMFNPLTALSKPLQQGTIAGVMQAGEEIQNGEDFGKSLWNIGTSAASTALITKGAQGAGNFLAKLKNTKDAARSVYNMGVDPSADEAKLMQKYTAGTIDQNPVTRADVAVERGIAGTEKGIGTQAEKARAALYKQEIEPTLQKIQSKVKAQDAFDGAEQRIKSEVTELSRKKDLLEALSALKEDYLTDGKLPEFSAIEADRIKQGLAEFVPQKAFKGNDISQSFNQVKKYVSDEFRNKIRDLAKSEVGTDIAKSYRDYNALRELSEIGVKARTGGKFKGGTGGFLSGLKDKAVTPVASYGALAINKAGKPLELIGGLAKGAEKTLGQKNLNRILSVLSQTRGGLKN